MSITPALAATVRGPRELLVLISCAVTPEEKRLVARVARRVGHFDLVPRDWRECLGRKSSGVRSYALATEWDESKHPRGWHGHWIKAGMHVKVDRGQGDWLLGTVQGVDDANDSVRVRPDGGSASVLVNAVSVRPTSDVRLARSPQARVKTGEGDKRTGLPTSGFQFPDGRPMTRTQIGDAFERALREHGAGLLESHFGGRLSPFSRGGGGAGTRQTPLDFQLGGYGVEVKTLLNTSANWKTAMSRDEKERKLRTVQELKLDPLLVAQVVDQHARQVDVYYLTAFESRAITRMTHLGTYTYPPQAILGRLAHSGGDNSDMPDSIHPYDGDLLIRVGRDGVPVVEEHKATLLADARFEGLHPRDMKGRFIEKFAHVHVFLDGAEGHSLTGTVVSFDGPHGPVRVRVDASPDPRFHTGQVISAAPDHVEVVPDEVARLPGETARVGDPTPPDLARYNVGRVVGGWTPKGWRNEVAEYDNSGQNTIARLTSPDGSVYWAKETPYSQGGGVDAEVDASRILRAAGDERAPVTWMMGDPTRGHEFGVLSTDGGHGLRGTTVLWRSSAGKGNPNRASSLEELNLADPKQLIQYSVFDALAQNGDRHSGNFLYGHDESGKGVLVPIDHEYTLGMTTSPNAHVESIVGMSLINALDRAAVQYMADLDEKERERQVDEWLARYEKATSGDYPGEGWHEPGAVETFNRLATEARQKLSLFTRYVANGLNEVKP